MATNVTKLEDPTLGAFTWNADLGWFEGRMVCGAETCSDFADFAVDREVLFKEMA